MLQEGSLPSDVVELSGEISGNVGPSAEFAVHRITKKANAAELMAAIERFSAAGEHDQRAAFRALLETLKMAHNAERFEETAQALRLVLTPMLDYTSLQSLNKVYKALPSNARGQTKIKIAMLGGFTTHQLRELLELYLFAAGVSAEIYEADYGVFRQEILDPSGGLYRFQPNTILLATHWRNLANLPELSDPLQKVIDLVQAEYEHWVLLWRTAHDRLGCQILQNNFDTPPWRSLDNYEMRHGAALAPFIAEVNRLFTARAPSYVTIHDVDALAANAGRRTWGNERFFLHAKMPCAPEYLAEYAYSISTVITAQLGLSRKCLVLDLDNTLWGGVIGDDGLSGIRIGEGDPEGEAFLSFQRYLKILKTRGVILAVCSKNNEHTAREVFEKHPDMILRPDDISCFAINWSDKATNLRNIARQLNIGLDSIVFVDDNPAERSIVRQMVPEVAVPEVSGDPLEFIEVLDRYRYFQVATLGAEDFRRADYYRANAKREEIQAAAGGIDNFLQSLDMTATIGPIQAMTLERSTQLINKSNQFNLTTRRRNQAEVMALMKAPDWLTATVSLRDRFGENGLICVVLACMRLDVLDIDTWLMSCRVLKRGVEHFVLNYLCDLARKRHLSSIRGEYIPTAKNDLVRNHYAELGFHKIEMKPNGHTVWELPLAGFKPLPNFIKQV